MKLMNAGVNTRIIKAGDDRKVIVWSRFTNKTPVKYDEEALGREATGKLELYHFMPLKEVERGSDPVPLPSPV